MPAQFTDDEILEVRAKYPGLEAKGPGILEGEFRLHAEYEGLALEDCFAVRIKAHNPHSARLPALEEIGGRTKAIGSKYGISDLRMLHRNSDGTACVCVRQVELEKFPLGAPLMSYVENLVVPYLYGLSFYDKHGKWPWPDYSHGGLGLLEFYADTTNERTREEFTEVLAALKSEPAWRDYYKQLKKPSSKRGCLCGSGKQFSRCHSRAWEGLKRAHTELERLAWNPSALPKK